MSRGKKKKTKKTQVEQLQGSSVYSMRSLFPGEKRSHKWQYTKALARGDPRGELFGPPFHSWEPHTSKPTDYGIYLREILGKESMKSMFVNLFLPGLLLLLQEILV